MIEAVMLKAEDNIGLALVDLKPDSEVKIYGREVLVKLAEPVPYQHKFSVMQINSGQEIIKDGVVIGKATRDIAQGQHVHTHNMTGLRMKVS